MNVLRVFALVTFGALLTAQSSFAAEPAAFFQKHCTECHSGNDPAGHLDLSKFPLELDKPENFSRWVKIHDRISSGEMPPKDQPRPAAAEVAAATATIAKTLIAAEKNAADPSRTTIRRLTRSEYENTIRDLFALDGVTLQGDLPPDGVAHGFDKNDEALSVSHVILAKYYDTAERVLDMAIATQPTAPQARKQRVSLATPASGVAHIMLHGDALMLKDKKADPEFPPAGLYHHIDQGAHQQMGMFDRDTAVGLFRHQDESFAPYFLEFACLYPGKYRIKISLWSFFWEKGELKPSNRIEPVCLSAVQLQGDGRHTGHPSYPLAYLDAPSIDSQVHELTAWLNYKDTIGYNTSELIPGQPTRHGNRLLTYRGPGVACDWFEIEGPLHDVWPPRSHQALFGDLPLVEFKPEENPGVRPPRRKLLRQETTHGKNQPDQVKGLWTVRSEQPLADAERLLATFLPRAFRRPLSDEVRALYVAKVDERLKSGDSFESAMRWAYRAALCSPDFLYHIEPAGKLDDFALASRLSYFFWNSMPDEPLLKFAGENKLHEPAVLKGEVERLLNDDKSKRFAEDFLAQWLSLNKIAANDPDHQLYPEFNGFLQDSMVAESRAYLRELLAKNLDATYLVKSNFATINEPLARLYGLSDVKGTQIRRIDLPADCPRGPFLAQAAVMKITANGTTTSPVPRGAFVMSRFLGQTPEPPPPNITAIEPDVRGTVTIRQQLEKHRSDQACAACHRKMDPPGFALESFDVIGGYRQRYRSMGMGDSPGQGMILPRIWPGFKLGPTVDASGELPDGRKFTSFQEFQSLLAAQPEVLLQNFARQLAVYSTGRQISFGDRAQIAAIVKKTQDQGGGLRTLMHELTQSELFQTK
jgi:hypothetical protein